MAASTLETVLPAFRAYVARSGNEKWVEDHVRVVQQAEAACAGDGARLVHACIALYDTHTAHHRNIVRTPGGRGLSIAWAMSQSGQDAWADLFTALAADPQHVWAMQAFGHLHAITRQCSGLWKKYLAYASLDSRVVGAADDVMRACLGDAAWLAERESIVNTRARVDALLSAVPSTFRAALTDAAERARGTLRSVESVFRVHDMKRVATEDAGDKYVAIVRVEAEAGSFGTVMPWGWRIGWPRAATGWCISVGLFDADGVTVPFEYTSNHLDAAAAPCNGGVLHAADDRCNAAVLSHYGFLALRMHHLSWRPLHTSSGETPRRVTRIVCVKACFLYVAEDGAVTVRWMWDPREDD